MTEPRKLSLDDLPRCKALSERLKIQDETAAKLCVGPPSLEQMTAMIQLMDDARAAWGKLAMRLEAEAIPGVKLTDAE